MNDDIEEEHPFGSAEEEGIISYIIDNPGFYSSIRTYLTPDLFRLAESRYIIEIIDKMADKYNNLPPRALVIEHVLKSITVNDDHRAITELLERESDPREVDHIKQIINDWAKHQAYYLLFSAGVDAFEDKNYGIIDDLVERAQRITEDTGQGVNFFDDIGNLFVVDSKEHFSTGFVSLDEHINADHNGIGPCRKEVCCWMASTGVGKTTMLVNNAVQGMIDGYKVLYVTMETGAKKIQQRVAGAITNIPIKKRVEYQSKVEKNIQTFRRSFDGDLKIYEYPPEEISVDHIYSRISKLNKLEGWQPDIIIIDYMELMLSRRSGANSDNEYLRQKKVSTEMRGLAFNEDVLVFTAIQTNRSGAVNDGPSKNIGLGKVAESYGKLMPLDYVISIVQTDEEKAESRARLYIEKNRNGPNHRMVPVVFNYDTQKIRQESGMGIQI